MAKIRHNNINDTASEIFTIARDNQVLHLYAQDEKMDGTHLTINGNKALHFGTCGYLGLEQHEKMKEAAIQAIHNYGVQFPMSKSYVSNPLYAELENLVQTMYNAPVVISKNCTLSHLATIPTIVRENDAVIMDHQVHSSVQAAVQKLLAKGVRVEMIRHNNLEMLEETILRIKDKHEKIWYMADGVYSMYGDFAPVKEMIELAQKYDQLYLYVDDAHGMSWAGKHGTGYVMSQMPDGLYEKMVLTATMGKGFGACGGLTIFPNKEWHHQVKIFGGPLTFSVQLEPPILGSAIASAKIHLSDEISQMQEELQQKIAYTNALIKNTRVPLIAENNSPIFFIGTGAMSMTNRLIQRLITDGIYVNAAPFPAVPAKNTGVRITISLHNSYKDIEELVDKLSYHFDEALDEVGQTHEKIRKAFRMEPLKTIQPDEDQIKKPVKTGKTHLEVVNSISEINKDEWNRYVGHRGMFDHGGMKYMEKSFSCNERDEENWDFRYFTVRDESGKVILMTFCIIGLYKEDTFARTSISKQIEEVRQTDPYYLTSKAVIMGSMFTEGEHLYIDRLDDKWKDAVGELVEALYKEQDLAEASNVVLRDFDAGDPELNDLLHGLGFVKVDMPESCVLEKMDLWNTENEYRATLSKSAKKHFKEEIRKYQDQFDVEVKETLDEYELELAWKLFMNVKNKNYGLNTFAPPKKVFYEMNTDSAWEFVILRLKDEYSDHSDPIAIVMNHKNEFKVYSLMLIGMDYDYIYQCRGYLQALYQCVKRAKSLGYHQANFGISATTEKKKLGVKVYPRVAYLNAKDNFNMEMMTQTMLVNEE